jgi:hypothetical protein
MAEQQFKPNEPGFSHPHLPLSIRTSDDGCVYIQAGDSAGIVINMHNGKVTIYGATVNIISGELEFDGIPVDKPSILQHVVGKVRRLFGEVTPKFPAPKE